MADPGDMTGRVGAVILCDDIRREISGKDILIGVYARDIVVPQFPITLMFALWLEYFPDRMGEGLLSLRVSWADKSPAVLKAALNVEEFGVSGLALPGIQMTFDQEGELRMELSNGDQWIPLLRKKVLKGEVRSLVTPPSPGNS